VYSSTGRYNCWKNSLTTGKILNFFKLWCSCSLNYFRVFLHCIFQAHQDSESKVNLAFLNENILRRLNKPLLASSILPTLPVTINWHGQKLDRISEQWLVSATLKLNPRLRLCPKNQLLGLHAITRLDLSTNKLEKIPSSIFTLCSLKYLNLSQNKLDKLDFPDMISSPWLEEISLQVFNTHDLYFIEHFG